MFKCKAMGKGTCQPNQKHIYSEQTNSPAATQSASFSIQASIQSFSLSSTHSVCVGDVRVVEWRQGRQLRVIGRVVRETHDVIGGLNVAMTYGE